MSAHQIFSLILTVASALTVDKHSLESQLELKYERLETEVGKVKQGLQTELIQGKMTDAKAYGIFGILSVMVAASTGSVWYSRLSGENCEKVKLKRGSPEEQRRAQLAVQQASSGMGDWKCMICACILGVLNNNAYSTVMGASQPLAKQFAMQDYMSLFSTFLLASCTCATFFNSALCLKIGIHVRILVLLTFVAGGYIVLSIASTMAGKAGFMTALLACSLVGVATSLGEIGNLAFFRAFPASILGAWGAGTGIAGITGGSVYVFFRSLELSNPQIFALMCPSVLIYYGCFRYLYFRAKQCGVLNLQKEIGEKNAELNLENAKDVSRYTWAILINMVAVYTLEYTIYPGLVDRDTLCPISKGFLATNAFTLMWTCYNIGVTLSRASVSWFRIENLWLITGLQALNVALWFVEATEHTILNYFGNTGYYILLAWMVWVGLMGGCCYANCMYAYNTWSNIPDNYRELGINLGFAMSNIGIFAATNITTLLQTTVLSSDKLYPGGCPAL